MSVPFDTSAVREVLVEELNELRHRISQSITATGQRASGRTQATMQVEVFDDLHASLTGRPAFGTLETGRRPGRVPQNFVAIIKKWIKDKGLAVRPIPDKGSGRATLSPQERGLNTMAYFIARKIRTDGTSLFRAGGRSDVYSPHIEEAMKNIETKLNGIYKASFTTIRLNT